jgi:hypothetical protein
MALDENLETSQLAQPTSEPQPIAGFTYWVRCEEGYRVRAIYTSSGKWLLPHNGEEVKGVVGFNS